MTDFDRTDDHLDPAPDTMEEQADLNRPYGEVTAEDLALDELTGDGADLMAGDSETSHYVRPDDDPAEETIEERLLQEEFDPNSAIVPSPGAEDRAASDRENRMLTEEVTKDVDVENAES